MQGSLVGSKTVSSTLQEMPGALGQSLIRQLKEEPGSKVGSLRDLCSSHTSGMALESTVQRVKGEQGVCLWREHILDTSGARVRPDRSIKPALGDRVLTGRSGSISLGLGGALSEDRSPHWQRQSAPLSLCPHCVHTRSYACLFTDS